MFLKIFTSKLWDIIWLTVGIILVAFSAVFSAMNNAKGYMETMDIVLAITSFIGSILGMISVNLYANKKGKRAAQVSVAGGFFDFFNNYMYGVIGNMFVGAYSIIINTRGIIKLGKTVNVTKANRKNFIYALVIAALGVIVLIAFGKKIIPENAPIWVMVLNAFVFIIPVCAQYLMIEGKAIAHILWIVNNIINIVLFSYTCFFTENRAALVYLAMAFMFLINSIKAATIWYSE